MKSLIILCASGAARSVCFTLLIGLCSTSLTT